MPLARSNTKSRARSQSRSPIPPSSAYFQKQSPKFQPPSYYAAASRSHQSGVSDGEYDETMFEVQHTQNLGDTFMPIYDSESDTHSSVDKVSLRSRGRDGSVDSTKSRRRQSQIGNLPLVEAQLLPSLKDTIDRMTRAPSIIGTPISHTQTISRGRSTTSLSPSSPYGEHTQQTSQPQIFTDLASGDGPGSTTQERTPVASRPLKSALRAPVSKSSSKSSSSTPTTPIIGSSTLKSVKSILKRRVSGSRSPKSASNETPAKQYAKASHLRTFASYTF
jgi:hypothetical protein